MSEIEEREEGQVVLPSLEIAWPPAEFELRLRRPVTWKEETFESLPLREPTLAEFERILAQPEAKRRCASVSIVTGIPEGAVRMMDIGDVVRAEAYLTSFFDIGQVIGVS